MSVSLSDTVGDVGAVVISSLELVLELSRVSLRRSRLSAPLTLTRQAFPVCCNDARSPLFSDFDNAVQSSGGSGGGTEAGSD